MAAVVASALEAAALEAAALAALVALVALALIALVGRIRWLVQAPPFIFFNRLNWAGNGQQLEAQAPTPQIYRVSMTICDKEV